MESEKRNIVKRFLKLRIRMMIKIKNVTSFPFGVGGVGFGVRSSSDQIPKKSSSNYFVRFFCWSSPKIYKFIQYTFSMMIFDYSFIHWEAVNGMRLLKLASGK